MPDAPRFTGSVPERYETHMVPLLMAPCAADLARRAAALHPRRVLELAAGTGVLTRELVKVLDAGAALTATDVNPPMLAVAQRLLGSDRVTWQQADVHALPFADRTFDLAISQFGIMFVPDKVAVFREMHRVLQPGGTYLFNSFQPLADNPIGAAPNDVLARLYAPSPPAFFRVPFSYGDRSQIAADLRAAGFHEIVAEPVEYETRMVSPDHTATALLEGTPMFHELTERGGPPLDEVHRELAATIERMIGGPGARLPLRVVVTSAHA